ncbi:alcohol oxidase [Pseudovirgaria hyperparasitica]|uniref:Alcohol oxidase n=1 Tax=Pseudovirgaria hyperparasitica TaxID=470096 RepID=A0A6A6WAK8_9PEZI|nr:alcohol oxidase [Pseudovirgaria hyperparasitica]KAF2759898.1 alcohol oxidase [Pseudovirgaria hyperparasitica]
MHASKSLTGLIAALGIANICCASLLNQYLAPGKLSGNSFGLPGANATYDYVVVGAGLAGSIVAARLAENLPDATVAVVEAGSFYEISNGNYSQIPHYSPRFAGSDPDDWHPLIDWGLVTEPVNAGAGRRFLYAQGKTLGGSSARNQQIYHRGTKGWHQSIVDATGDDAWNWENMFPFMKTSFSFTPPDVRFRAANATANFSLEAYDIPGGPAQLSFPKHAQPISSYGPDAYAAAGFNATPDFLQGNLLGYGYWSFTLNPEDSTRSSTETSFLSPALEKTSLKVYQSCMARNILFDENKKATGVNVTVQGIKSFMLSARKEVIVSTGAMHSPQLLMVSGVGPESTLNQFSIPIVAALPHVGQNLHDTPNLGGITHSMNVDSASTFESNPATFAAASEQFFTNGSGPLSSPSGDFAGWEVLPKSSRTGLSNSTLQWLDSIPSDWPTAEYVLGAGSSSLLQAGNTNTRLGNVGVLLTASKARGSVTLASASNADQPIINIPWLASPEDREVAIAAFKRARTIASHVAAFGDEVRPGANVTSDAQILDYIMTKGLSAIHHAASTCRMGKSAEDGVVDSQGRVFGVQGLRVVDASVLPYSAPGHTQGVTYAVAEKLVADIIRDGME